MLLEFDLDVGEVAEWPNVPDSKSGVPQGTVGSNPTLSASNTHGTRMDAGLRYSGRRRYLPVTPASELLPLSSYSPCAGHLVADNAAGQNTDDPPQGKRSATRPEHPILDVVGTSKPPADGASD